MTPSREQQENSRVEATRAAINAIPAGQQASIREMIEWVIDNALLEKDDLDLSTCPSRGALFLWHWASKPANQSNFVTVVWSKLIPPKTQGESEPQFNDDGRKILEVLDRFDESFGSKDEN
jgi:hypothetical protein